MLRKILSPLLVIFLLLSPAAAITSCSGGGGSPAPSSAASPSPSTIPEPDYAGAMVENILLALNNNDYARYIQDFDPNMKQASPETFFKQLAELVKNKIGAYVPDSKQFYQAGPKDKYTVVIYIAKYTGEPAGVAVTVSFDQIEGKTLVGGFYLNSPRLAG